MSNRDYFLLGCKLFGIYCLVISIPTIISFFQVFAIPQDVPPEYTSIIRLSVIASCMVPILLIILAIYLIRDGEHLYRFAYPNSSDTQSSVEEKFMLFLKMLGMYLIIQFFPDFLKTISSLLVDYNAPKYMDMFQERHFAYLNILPSTASILLGFYLLKSGKIFVRIGLRGGLPTEKEK